MKILVVEDESFILESIAMVLTREGYLIYTADNFHAAIKLIKSESFDMIISDIMLPYTGGFDIVDFVRNDPEKKHTSIILITGMDKVILETSNINVEACIVKPFTASHLLRVVKENLLVKT